MSKSVFTDTYDHFRELLIEARRNSNMTQVQLAEKLDRPQSFVSKYERGERRLDVVEFLQVAAALQIDPCQIIKALQEQ